MADTKRGSIAGRVATPKTAGASSVPAIGDNIEALAKAIGARVKVTTTAPYSQTYEGTLYTACPILNLVAINSRSPPPNPSTNTANQPGDFHIIPVARLQTFNILSLATGAESSIPSIVNTSPAIGPVDTKRLKACEEERVQKLKEDEINRGRGVTREGQSIFDALKRVNVPIRWHNQEMIVHEAVIIAPPYRPEDCKGSKDKQQVLNQVKKVLEGERRKLREREERERKAAGTPPGGQRKGG